MSDQLTSASWSFNNLNTHGSLPYTLHFLIIRAQSLCVDSEVVKINARTHARTHAHTHTHTYIHTHVCTSNSIYAQTQDLVFVNGCANLCVCACESVYVNAQSFFFATSRSHKKLKILVHKKTKQNIIDAYKVYMARIISHKNKQAWDICDLR